MAHLIQSAGCSLEVSDAPAHEVYGSVRRRTAQAPIGSLITRRARMDVAYVDEQMYPGGQIHNKGLDFFLSRVEDSLAGYAESKGATVIEHTWKLVCTDPLEPHSPRHKMMEELFGIKGLLLGVEVPVLPGTAITYETHGSDVVGRLYNQLQSECSEQFNVAGWTIPDISVPSQYTDIGFGTEEPMQIVLRDIEPKTVLLKA